MSDIVEKLAEECRWLDEFITFDMAEVIRAARGREHVPDVVDSIRQRRAHLMAWKRDQLAELEAELRFEEHEMADRETPGRIVRFEDCDGNVIATDDKGQRFITPAGRFDWTPLPRGTASVEPPPKSRWRRSAAA